MLWPPDSPWAPWWRTDKNTARALCRAGSVKAEDLIYDLGCGDATALIVATKEFGARGVGVEIDPIRFLIAKLRVKLKGLEGKVTILRNNFFKEDLSKATVIFVYLVPKALARLKPKLLRELKPGTRIASYRYTMDLDLVKEDKANKIYVYRI